MDLPVAGDEAPGTDEDGRVVDPAVGLLGDPGDEVEAPSRARATSRATVGPRDGLGQFREFADGAELVAGAEELGEDPEVGLILGEELLHPVEVPADLSKLRGELNVPYAHDGELYPQYPGVQRPPLGSNPRQVGGRIGAGEGQPRAV